LRRALQNEVTKSGAFFEAMKAAKKFVAEQTREYDNVAGSLVDEMAQWVEVPRDARRLIANLLSEGGNAEESRERVLLAVRDLPAKTPSCPRWSAKRRASCKRGAAKTRRNCWGKSPIKWRCRQKPAMPLRRY
jgi:hypothetical protein